MRQPDAQNFALWSPDPSSCCLAPPPPDHGPGDGEGERQSDEKGKSDQIQRDLIDLETAVGSAARLDRDHVVRAGQPVDDVEAEIEIAAVAEESVGQKL